MEREDTPLLPVEALREALANAFVHRDYAVGGGSVGVALYDDRLEIISIGELHFGLTPEALFREHESKPWNPMIARTFYRRGAHSTDRGHSFQADRGQCSGRSRTPWVGCLSDGLDGRPTVRHQFGTLSAMGVERDLPGCPRGALAPGGQPGAEGVLDTVVVGCSLVHGGGVACDEQPPRWARRAEAALRWRAWDAVRLGPWPGAATHPSAPGCASRAATGP